ncbi:MAG TPA: topoisomerase DNA-binding C4 zinc finger domain-containing protein [Candidatus Hydrogenedentes bacterium]|nr:topoisomerase DNA-binding C4 zinc finger domain-containing protein [Candidatus Hydrogenedentota bacterium]
MRAALTPYLPGIQSSNADEESPRTQADIKTQQSDSQKVCPKCSSPLVKRTVKNGSNKGSTFWGCSNYPNCRYTENIN